MSILKAENLSFAYGKSTVFSNVNFEVNKGEMFCLVGPNGCGKSTLLHCILGHIKYQKGSVFVNDKDINQFSAKELSRFLSYVPQNHTRSFPYKSIDVVTMGQMYGDYKRNLKQTAGEIMEQMGISHLAQKEYTALSGGELQLVLIARALYQDSEILVLDEPTSHLDIKYTQMILNILVSISKQYKKTVIMSTHDFNHPLQFEDEGANVRMALMENGSISTVSTPLKLLSSDSFEKMYNINKQIITLENNPNRHFVAVWGK